MILPKEIWYPFPITPYYNKIVVLMQQFAYIFHSSVIQLADSIFFMMLHIARAKLEILNDELKQVVDENQLKKCIQDHQEIIWFIEEINKTSGLIILKTVFAAAFYLTLGYLQLLHKHETIDPVLVHQFLLMIAVVNYRMFFGTLCADAIYTLAEDLRYSVPWVSKSSGASKSMYIIIQRCQKPLRLFVTGFVPTYSLVYYASFLSSTFSYFLYIKAILKL
ncbi:uncharacterized protein LOC117168171 [Belonocnema kinseyi]|uniref:uncharacterized protein LOC117168171 n=1 Tax=Belonocnema kinseyi TaxID=2817044 RepID=UPI00143DAF21|nr:uncharacterized protein LOC117168171 [Belonocnema kinseyi]